MGNMKGLVWWASVLTRTLIESLKQNLGLALIALGLSTFLWLVITSEQNPPKMDIFPSSIPVTAINVPPGLEVFGEIEPVRIKISGPQEVWNRLRPSSFRITADLSKAGVGVQEVPILGQVMDSQARVLEYLPPKVTVRLESVKSKEVPVSVNLIDSVPFGYVYKQPVVSLDKITISGPGPLVDQVDSVIADVRLEGVKVDIKESFKLTPRSAQGNKIEGVRSDPQTVEIEIAISQQVNYRTVAVTPALTGNVSRGYWVSGVSSTPDSLTVVGTRDALKDLNFVKTSPVVVDGATSNVVQSASVVLPDGVSLAGQQKVSVEVTVQALSGSKIFRVPVAVTGVGQGRDAQAGAIDVVVEGSVPRLGTLKPSEVVAAVSVLGLNPGIYKLAPQVQVPSELKVTNISPSEVDTILK